MAAASVHFKRSSSFTWKIRNPFSSRYLESGMFYFDRSKWKLSVGYSNMLDTFPFILRRVNGEEEPLSAFEFELFVQADDRRLHRVTSDNFRVVDCSPVTLWMPTRNLTRQLSSVLCTDQVWTFVFVLTSNTPPQGDDERVCDCQERCSTYGATTMLRANEEFSKNKKITSSNELLKDPNRQRSNYLDMEYLSQDFRRLLDSGIHPDVTLRCEEHTIPAHRALLSARSEVFAAMFDSDMSERRSGCIDIVDIDVPVLEQLLRYIYSGKLSDMSQDTAPALYEAADKYAMDSLKKRCANYMLDKLTEKNACDLLVLADAHSDNELKNCIVYFIVEKAIPLQENIWLNFSKNHTKLALEVLHCAFKAKYMLPHDKDQCLQ